MITTTCQHELITTEKVGNGYGDGEYLAYVCEDCFKVLDAVEADEEF